ncbi:MAG: hypothetical protein R3F56_09000 [Planctomycetota bacterium]
MSLLARAGRALLAAVVLAGGVCTTHASAQLRLFLDNLTPGEHQSVVNLLGPVGWRITSLCLTGGNNFDRYTSVWTLQPTLPWFAFHGVAGSFAQIMAAALAPAGYRPSVITATGSGSDERFALVLIKDGKPGYLKLGLSQAGLAAEASSAKVNGYVPTSITVYGPSTAPRYAATFAANTANITWRLTTGDTYGQFLNRLQNMKAIGMSPSYLASHWSHQRYAAVFTVTPPGTTVTAYSGLTGSEHDLKVAILKALDFVPLCVQSEGAGLSDGRYDGIWVH